MQSMLQMLTDFQQWLWEGHGKNKLSKEMELGWAGCQGSSPGDLPIPHLAKDENNLWA